MIKANIINKRGSDNGVLVMAAAAKRIIPKKKSIYSYTFCFYKLNTMGILKATDKKANPQFHI